MKGKRVFVHAAVPNFMSFFLDGDFIFFVVTVS